MILTYLIKSTLCLGILFVFYKIALESKALHHFKRYYLLLSLIFAYTIPLITFTYTKTVLEEQIWVEEFASAYQDLPQEDNITTATEVDYTTAILWGVYIIGFLIFGLRFGLNLTRLKQKINSAHIFEERDFTLALLTKTIVPHSFFKWIFLNKNQYLDQEIAPEVLAHEATHVRQKHSWDILFVELLQVVFWFNPLIWLSKVSIKLNHEFLADQGAIEDKSNIAIYQNILLSYAGSTHHTSLESPFNYSLTKKRILMLSQSFSKRKLLLRSLLLIPVVGLCILFFNQAIVAQAQLPQQSVLIGEWLDQETETAFLHIIEKNDSLWAYLQSTPLLIEKDTKGYHIKDKNFNKGARFYLSIDASGNLKYGDRTSVLIPSSNSIKKSIQGAWYNSITNNTYIFSTENGITCDVIKERGKPVRYWPILKDGGLSFTMGYDWVSFKREGDDLVFMDRNKQPQRLQRSNRVSDTDSTNVYDAYASKKSQEINYTTQFLEGAKRNGKKPIVLEIRNDKIKINGRQSTLATFSKDLDAITADWEEADYADPARTYMFKGNSKYFLVQLEKEYSKSHISKANGGAKLVPSPPPTLNAETSGKPPKTYSPLTESKEINTSVDIIEPKFIEAQIQENKNPKKFFVEFKENKISFNTKLIDINDLAKRFDQATKNWTPKDFEDNKSNINILAHTQYSQFLEEDFKRDVQREMEKTQFYKKTGKKIPFFSASPVKMVQMFILPNIHLYKSDLFYNDKIISLETLKEKLEKIEWVEIKMHHLYDIQKAQIYFSEYREINQS